MLPYSENDICTLYREAKNKKEQLEILADMNLTDEETIIAILNSNGYSIKYSELSKGINTLRKANKPRNMDYLYEKYKKLEQSGKTIAEASVVLGVKPEQVRRYAKKYGLFFTKTPPGRKLGYRKTAP